jgi:ATP-dependent RNA helicase DDX49/DBP8
MASRIKPKSSEKPAPAVVDTEVHNGKVVDAKSNFALLNVAPWLIASLAGLAIKRPTAIQKACIPEITKGRDVIGGSRTGSGKTVAFAVPILQKLFEDPMGIYAVVLTPTRYALAFFIDDANS